MEEKKKNSIYKNFMIVIITALITCIITTIVIFNATNQTGVVKSESFLGNMLNTITKPFKGGNETTTSLDEKMAEI